MLRNLRRIIKEYHRLDKKFLATPETATIKRNKLATRAIAKVTEARTIAENIAKSNGGRVSAEDILRMANSGPRPIVKVYDPKGRLTYVRQ